jgi:hypothetical protein
MVAEFDLSGRFPAPLGVAEKIVTILLLTIVIIAVPVGIMIFADPWLSWEFWFGSRGPLFKTLFGLLGTAIILLSPALVIMRLVEQNSEGMGIKPVIKLNDRIHVSQSIKGKEDCVGDEYRVSLRDVILETDGLLSGPSSDQATPPERRPDRSIIISVLKYVLWCLYFIALCLGVSLLYIKYMHPTLPNGMFWSLLDGLAQKKFYRLLNSVELIPAILIAWVAYLLVRARQKSAEHLLEYDERAPVLFLRSFKDDNRKVFVARKDPFHVKAGFGDALSDIFGRVGPFVGLGSKDEVIPKLGAARAYRDDAVWQPKINQWMKDARWIVCVLGSSHSLDWELSQIAKCNWLEKCIFMFPPELGGSSTKTKEAKSRAWSRLQDAFANTDYDSVLADVKIEDVILVWVEGRQVFVVKASGQLFQEYELASRIALYVKCNGMATIQHKPTPIPNQ